MKYAARKRLTYGMIVLYWVLSINLLSFISISSIRSFLALAGLEVDMENPMVKYWLSPHQYLEGTLFGIFFGLLFIGVTLLARRLRVEQMGFGKSILINSGMYLVGFVVINFLIYTIIGAFGYYGQYDFSSFVSNPDLISLVLVILSIVVFQILFLNFVLQSMQITGDYNIIRFLTGKYRTPVVEDRAFMFLDMRSSTQHAEKLGNVLYSALIRDCFLDLNYLLNQYEAEIYQYVGDEIVLTWPTSLAKEHQNIFGIFFAFRAALQNKSTYYLAKYGIVPEFKAGCNSGIVTAAEIGIIKRDIAFHGDVLNTAARAQDMCNTLKQDLLITALLKDQVSTSSLYQITDTGAHNLKGKGGVTELFGVSLLK